MLSREDLTPEGQFEWDRWRTGSIGGTDKFGVLRSFSWCASGGEIMRTKGTENAAQKLMRKMRFRACCKMRKPLL
jgi:hypothetical protein